MPYITLGIGILVIFLVVVLPDKKEKSLNDKGSTYSKTAASYESFDDSLHLKLGTVIDELSDNVHLASEKLDSQIERLSLLQESISSSFLDYEKDPKSQPEFARPPLPQKHKNVLALFKKGLNTTEIATRLNIGKGEIELILSLYEAGDDR